MSGIPEHIQSSTGSVAGSPGVLLVGNFLSAHTRVRSVCEEIADRLPALGWRVVKTSAKLNRLARLADMACTIFRARQAYQVAQVDVYSGGAFRWAEVSCRVLEALGKPYVLTLHGGNLPAFGKANAGRLRRLLSRAAAVTAPSGYLRQALQPYASNIRELPNALDTSRYPFRLRRTITPSLLWLRAFHEVYNPRMAAEAFELLARGQPQAKLQFVGPDKGDGTYESVREWVGASSVRDGISFIGGVPKSEVPTWLNQSDIFLNTSNIDNMPVTVLEAMACGMCVVSTNVGGVPFIAEHGRSALLVNAGDASGMAACLEQLLTNPALAEKLSQAARAKVMTFDWSVVLPQWDSLLRACRQGALAE